MKTAHTPGPWTHYRKATDKVRPFNVINEETSDDIARCVTEEDAALIAAAPDLLAALHEVTRCLAWHAQQHPVGMDSLAVSNARAAIAKATGAA